MIDRFWLASDILKESLVGRTALGSGWGKPLLQVERVGFALGPVFQGLVQGRFVSGVSLGPAVAGLAQGLWVSELQG